MTIILIAAMARNRVIGRDNALPWRLAGELARFKAITMGHTLVMGRRTFESIGRPLPGRKMVVVSRQPGYAAPGCLVAESLNAALALCQDDDKVFIAGGGQLYTQALPLAEEILLTILERDAEGDVFFPEFDQRRFVELSSQRVLDDSEPYLLVHLRQRHD
ncbi:MAG: dihydrofolate reductase [Thermodesulfobacteriota bacterium]